MALIKEFLEWGIQISLILLHQYKNAYQESYYTMKQGSNTIRILIFKTTVLLGWR